jgi:tartrate-resistant acid phosphatase type 5
MPRGRFVVALLVAVAAAGLARTGAAQAPPASSRESLLGFVGDQGTGDGDQAQVRDQMLRFPAQFMFLLGDNVYDRGRRSDFERKHDLVYLPVMTQGTRFHAALGNHDVTYCDASTRDPLPADHDAYVWNGMRCDVRDHLKHALFGYRDGRRYYSIPTDGSAQPLGEVFVLDSNTLHTSQTKLPPLREDNAQLEWLDRALGASRATWKIVAMHHPLHSPTVALRYFLFVPLGGGRTREFMLERQLRPILLRHRVDAVMTAHNHFYARMVPQDGIRYFVTGGGGRDVYGFDPQPGYVAAGGRYHHFLFVRLTPGFFEYFAIDEDGVARDAGRFAKGAPTDTLLPAGTLPFRPVR